ncbi:riboflavin synthase [Saccharomonospora piscinae]|uniref:Riboflavin synthase n=1 Tax=Saccharomonospora piscinae TaxID=687388 RepID=A0A1V9A9G7_SACPI|nr:riboflavin synthase [Saccharomonospora piscinae]OQO93772.1 riboflavin synthase [Saccharomonospora piscinae]TLW94935.1 riboflavin synthase [Saccharomonospora piscinae]
MFTGIVEELGEVTRVEPGPGVTRLSVRGPIVTSDARHGDSIAVNGVCLTVTGVAGDEFTVDVVPETLNRTSLAGVLPGRAVNLERALAADGRFGGHVVQGHVDGVGTFLSREADGLTHFAYPPSLARYVVEKGSVAVDGVSLTVANAAREEFAIALIPTTLNATTLGRTQPGETVNLEVDVLAKYVERLTAVHLPGAPVENGRGEEDR